MTAPPNKSSTKDVRIAVILLNYRTPGLVADCLATVVADIDQEKDVVIVVDNRSGDDSFERIQREIEDKRYERVTLVDSGYNGGFAYGNNRGIESVDAHAYLLLNSDTWIRPQTIQRLWDTMSRTPEAGLVSPRLEWPDGTPQISCFRYHSPWSELITSSSTSVVSRLLAARQVPLEVSHAVSRPEWTSFACVLIRREVFDEIGLLDDGFFMYYEDVDFCRRARRAGWEIVHDPRARVVHLRGGTSPVKKQTAARKRRPRYFYQSRSRYFRKAYGPAGLLTANLAWSAGRGISWLRERLGNKEPHTVANELFDTWRWRG